MINGLRDFLAFISKVIYAYAGASNKTHDVLHTSERSLCSYDVSLGC